MALTVKRPVCDGASSGANQAAALALARRSAQIVKLTRPIDRRSLLGRIRPHFQSLSRWFPNSFGKLVLLFPSSVRKVHDLNKGSPTRLLVVSVVTSVYRATQPRHLEVLIYIEHTYAQRRRRLIIQQTKIGQTKHPNL